MCEGCGNLVDGVCIAGQDRDVNAKKGRCAFAVIHTNDNDKHFMTPTNVTIVLNQGTNGWQVQRSGK